MSATFFLVPINLDVAHVGEEALPHYEKAVIRLVREGEMYVFLHHVALFSLERLDTLFGSNGKRSSDENNTYCYQ